MFVQSVTTNESRDGTQSSGRSNNGLNALSAQLFKFSGHFRLVSVCATGQDQSVALRGMQFFQQCVARLSQYGVDACDLAQAVAVLVLRRLEGNCLDAATRRQALRLLSALHSTGGAEVAVVAGYVRELLRS